MRSFIKDWTPDRNELIGGRLRRKGAPFLYRKKWGTGSTWAI